MARELPLKDLLGQFNFSASEFTDVNVNVSWWPVDNLRPIECRHHALLGQQRYCIYFTVKNF